MTSLIDVVFLLLVFFLVTFQVAAPEGNFDVKMSRASAGDLDPIKAAPLNVRVRLRADARGRLLAIQWADETLGQTGPFAGDPLGHLRHKVRLCVGDEGSPALAPSVPDAAMLEVELDCDPQLRYEHVVRALTHVSGYVAEDQIVRLTDRIKLTPPKHP